MKTHNIHEPLVLSTPAFSGTFQFPTHQPFQSHHINNAVDGDAAIQKSEFPLLSVLSYQSSTINPFLPNPNHSIESPSSLFFSSRSQTSLPSLHIGLVRDLMRDFSGLDPSLTGVDDGAGNGGIVDDGGLLELVPVATAYSLALLAGLLGNLLVIITILFGTIALLLTSARFLVREQVRQYCTLLFVIHLGFRTLENQSKLMCIIIEIDRHFCVYEKFV